jgi:hypothetical protein
MFGNQRAALARTRDLTTMSLMARVVAGGVLAAVVLTVFARLVPGGNPSTLFSTQNVAIRLVSGVLYVAIMTPLARRLCYRRLPRFLAIFVPLYLTGTVADLLEAYFYTTMLTPLTLVAALLFEGLPLLVITGIIAGLIPTDADARAAPRLGEAVRERSFFSWLGRIVVAGAPYPALYLVFAALVTPIEHAYYSDPAWIASLHTVVPSTVTTVLLEAGRGVLFVLAVLPVIAVQRTSRWTTGVYLALIGAVLEAWIPLLGQTSWPVLMRVGNVLELTADASGRALLMALLVFLPASPKRA